MTRYYTFEVEINADDLENLLAGAIDEGFLGYSETRDGQILKIAFFYDSKENASFIRTRLRENYKKVSELAEIENRDWNEEWKKTLTPVKITDKIWVSPAWLEPKLADGEVWIKIEPKMAFGTGHHETTRIAAKLICTISGAKTFLDVGAGSGILAFVAQTVGCRSITGVEIDEDCRENLQQNLADNKDRADIRFIIGSLEKINEAARFDAVAMNIIRTQASPLLLKISKILNKDGVLVWSGLLAEEKKQIVAEAQGFGFVLEQDLTENEWWGAKFTKK